MSFRERPARVLLLLTALAGACGANAHPTLAIGSPAPSFSLSGVDGKVHALADYAASPVLVVVFTCNHCPASQLYERRIQQLSDDYRSRGAAVVAINPNGPKSVPLEDLAYSDVGDSLEDMKLRVANRGLHYPYLYDGDTQAAAIAFGATVTPEAFIFDQHRMLRYVGRIDDLPYGKYGARVQAPDARHAIDALLASRSVPVATTKAEGCPTAWLTPGRHAAAGPSATHAEPVALQIAGPHELTQLRRNGTGKFLVVNFWATWCPPCVAEFPDFEATYRMYRARNVQLVTVSENTPDEQSGVLKFLREQQASSDNRLFASGDTGGLQNAFDPLMPASVPFTLVIAPNGDVLHQQLGEINILELRRAILANLPDDGKSQGLQAYWAPPSMRKQP